MMGTYRIRQGSRSVESANLVTDAGQVVIAEFLAGRRLEWAGSIALGSFGLPATPADTRPGFEFWRENIDLKETDGVRVIVRAVIPTPIDGVVHELGLWSLGGQQDENAGQEGVITAFDYDVDVIEGGTPNYDSSRASGSGADLTNEEIYMPNIRLSLDGTEQDHEFRLAYLVTAGTVNSVELRLEVDETNYRTFTLTPGAGYSVTSWLRQDMSQVGDAPWGELAGVRIIASGTGTVMLDALRSDPPIQPEDGEVFVSHTVLNEPFPISGDSELQIEYYVDIV